MNEYTIEKFNRDLGIVAERVESMVEITVTNTDDMLTPTATIMGYLDGEHRTYVVMVGGMPETSEEKQRLFESMGRALAAREPGFQPHAIFLTSEAWFKQFDKDSKEGQALSEGRRPNKRPSEYADRKEAIVIAGVSSNNWCNGSMIPILRDKNGKMSLDMENIQKGEYSEEDSTSFEAYILENFFLGFSLGIGEEPEVGRLIDLDESSEVKWH